MCPLHTNAGICSIEVPTIHAGTLCCSWWARYAHVVTVHSSTWYCIKHTHILLSDIHNNVILSFSLSPRLNFLAKLNTSVQAIISAYSEIKYIIITYAFISFQQVQIRGDTLITRTYRATLNGTLYVHPRTEDWVKVISHHLLVVSGCLSSLYTAMLDGVPINSSLPATELLELVAFKNHISDGWSSWPPSSAIT